MALPTKFVDGNQPETHGIGVNLIPGVPPTFQIELQRAPDDGSGGPGAFATIANLPPIPAASTFVDLLPMDNAFRHYRWRHIGPGYDPSPSWSAIGRGKPVRLEGPAAGGGLISFYPIVRDRPMTDGKWALRASEADGSTKVSEAFNNQGAFLPFVSPSPGTFFSYATGGPASGQMWVSFDWSSATLYRPDGTTATVPAPPAAPSAPTLSQVAGGALGARTRFAKVAYVKTDPFTGHESVYPVSAESSFAISANNLLKVTALADPGNGLYSGWVVLVGSTTGVNYVQGVTAKQTFGVDWTEPAGGFSTTQNSLWTASWKKLTKIGLDPVVTYKHYPYWHIALNFVYIPAETTNPHPQLASLQNGDGVMSLGQYGTTQGFSGVVDIATPAAAGSASGTRGGGRLT